MTGACNIVQVVAKSVVRAYDCAIRNERDRSFVELARSLFDNWLQVEHREVWDEVERIRSSESDEVKLDQFSADTMDEMIDNMRRWAGMFDV